MAAIVYPNAALLPLSNRVLNGNVHYHLFNNNYTVARNTVLGNFVEVAVSGYAPILVHDYDFVFQFLVGDHGISQAAPISFLNSSGSNENVFGYFVTDLADTTLLWAMSFDVFRVLLAGSIPFPITPYLGDFSQYP